MKSAPPPPSERQLRAFHMVVETGGVTAAAQALGLTQPAVTSQIRTLERDREVLLFDRTATGLTPTEAGLALHQVTRRLFQTFADARDVLAGAADLSFGTLRLGADAPFAAMPMLARYSKAHPGVAIEVSMGNAASTERDLLNGRIDVAVLSNASAPDGVHVLRLSRQSLSVLMPADHPLTDRKKVPVMALDGLDFVGREVGSATRKAMEARCEAHGVTPAIRLTLGSREAVREAVAAGFGVTVVFEGETGSDTRLVGRPLAGGATDWWLTATCLDARRDLPTVRAFLALAETA